MNYSNIDFMSIVDGEGCRVSLFVSGCRNHCKGCFNTETWDFNYGKPFTQVETNEIIEAMKKPYIAGLTILGGEPFEEENQQAIWQLLIDLYASGVMMENKNIWMFTGYVYDKDLLPGQRKNIPHITDTILMQIDTLVDGPFIQEQRDLNLKFRGSSNQRILTRYDRDHLKDLKRIYEDKRHN